MRNEKICTAPLALQSFEQMHGRLKAPIRKYIYILTGTFQECEDVSQEIFIKLWINWPTLKRLNEEELKNYVFILTRNHIINLRRDNNRPKRNTRKFLSEYARVTCWWYTHDEIIVKEGFNMHRQAVARLTEKERMVYLFHQNEYSALDIARLLRRSVYTINNQLSAANRAVKEDLKKMYGLHEAGKSKYTVKPASLN